MTPRTVAGLVLVAAWLAGCGGAMRSEEQEPTGWSASRVREQWPEYEFGTGPACLTVWVVRGDGCAVSDETGAPLACVSTEDPFILNAVPDRFGTCIIGIDDCARWTCSEM